MSPEQARALQAELESATADVRDLTAGMAPAALTKRPAHGGWSVAENLQHLILSAEAMSPLIEAGIGDLERQGRKARGPSGLGLVGWMLVKALEPPPRMRSRTTKPFEPVSSPDPLALVSLLEASHEQLSGLITRASGLATSEVKIVSPFNARAKYNLYAGFRIMLAHIRRHLWQAHAAKNRD